MSREGVPNRRGSELIIRKGEGKVLYEACRAGFHGKKGQLQGGFKVFMLSDNAQVYGNPGGKDGGPEVRLCVYISEVSGLG